MKSVLTTSLLLCVLALTIQAQTYEKVADETFKYIKAGTFGKPKVAKNTSKLAIGQVRVHYKFITSRAALANKNNAADVTVYLDGEMTKGDLQKLTDEFYTILQQKLAAAGVSFADWKAIEATEYFAERQKSQEDKKPQDSDGKNGQAWLSFSAFDGPVLLKWKPSRKTSSSQAISNWPHNITAKSSKNIRTKPKPISRVAWCSWKN